MGGKLDRHLTGAVLESIQACLHNRQFDLRKGITRKRDAPPEIVHRVARDQLSARNARQDEAQPNGLSHSRGFLLVGSQRQKDGEQAPCEPSTLDDRSRMKRTAADHPPADHRPWLAERLQEPTSEQAD